MSANPPRVLLVATVVKTHIMTFHIPCLKMFKEMGYETFVAARNDYEDPKDCNIPYCDHFLDIPFQRNPFRLRNLQCYKELKKILDEGEFSIIHCHTPVGGVLGRLAARKARKKGTRVIYTAHGFHFYRGAPLLNWLLYYPIEKICARFSDGVVTINQEDWKFAQQHFKNTRVFYLPGIGVDTRHYAQEPDRTEEICGALKIGTDAKRILSVGELNDNKNQKTVIRALTLPGMETVQYLIAGDGVRRKDLEAYAAELHVSDRVHFLGFRKDIAALLRAADVFVFPSYREGLPVSLMEAMASGIPVVASCIRGNVDLIEDGVNGFLCDPKDAKGFADSIQKLLECPDLAEAFAKNSLEKIQKFDKDIVAEQLQKIYRDVAGLSQEND